MSAAIRVVHIPKFRSSRVVWMYHELQELYGSNVPNLELTTFKDISSFRLNKPQWLLDINPNGKVPTMVHGPVVMFEGGAICSYLIDLFDTDRKLLPRDAEAMSIYYMMVSWCASTLDNLMATSSPIAIVLDRATAPKPMDDVDTNHKYFVEILVPYFSKQINKSGGPYLCGAQFTAADVILGYFLLRATDKFVPAWVSPTENPDMYVYVQLLLQRPALQKAICPVEQESSTLST